jgi:hypothetical protein
MRYWFQKTIHALAGRNLHGTGLQLISLLFRDGRIVRQRTAKVLLQTIRVDVVSSHSKFMKAIAALAHYAVQFKVQPVTGQQDVSREGRFIR